MGGGGDGGLFDASGAAFDGMDLYPRQPSQVARQAVCGLAGTPGDCGGFGVVVVRDRLSRAQYQRW